MALVITLVQKLLSLKVLLRSNHSQAEAYSEPCQTSKMELFAKIVTSFRAPTVFSKNSILNV